MKQIKLVAFNAKYIHSCLALFCLRNELEQNLTAIDAEILQLTINDNYYECFLNITEGEPFAVFFSAAIWNSDLVGRMVRDVRRCLPECRIVVGGPQAGVLREELPAAVCSVVTGEIEAVDSAFYRDLESGELAPKYVGSFHQKRVQHFDYPYHDEDFSRHLQNRHVYYESSRGCPYACTYCLSASERGLFHKDLDQVRAELTDMLRHNPKVVRFVDRTFNDIPKRALEIWRFLLEQECDTLFHFEIAPERFTEEMFQLLEKVEHGKFQFEIGIQSTNDPTLEAIRRKIDCTQVHEIVSRLVGLQTIHLHVDLILGLPYDTEETFKTSFGEVFAMGAHYIQMGLLKILPDTPICHGADEYGYLHSSSPPYSVFANRWLDHKQISKLYWFSECVEKFYNNRYFVSLWKYLRLQGEDIYAFFQKLLEEGQKVELLNRAATQELLCKVLMQGCRMRTDFRLIVELLRYDWLRCGFRKLPDCLRHEESEESIIETREILYRELPDDLEGMYTRASRNRFFKKSIFLHLSAEAVRVTRCAPGESAVRMVILPDRETTLYQHNITCYLQAVGGDVSS